MNDFSAFTDLAQVIKAYLENHDFSQDTPGCQTLFHLVRAKNRLSEAEMSLAFGDRDGARMFLGDTICELFILWQRAREELTKKQ